MNNIKAIFFLSTIFMFTHAVTGQVMQVKGIEYAQSLPDESSIVKFPDWNPMTEPCPLGPSEAIQLASKCLLTSVPDSTNLVFSSLSIHKEEAILDELAYTVNFRDKSDPIFGDWASIIVFFDGTIPPPKAIKKLTSPNQQVDSVESDQSPELVYVKDSNAKEQLVANTPNITNELSTVHAADGDSLDICVKQGNRCTVLALNQSMGTITHYDGADNSGVSRSSISNTVDEVIITTQETSSNDRGFRRENTTIISIQKTALPYTVSDGMRIFIKDKS